MKDGGRSIGGNDNRCKQQKEQATAPLLEGVDLTFWATFGLTFEPQTLRPLLNLP